MDNSKKNIILYVSIAGILILVLVLAFSLRNLLNGGANIKFVVNPKTTTFTIRGEQYTGDQTIQIPSGKYNISFTQKLFLSESKDIIVERGKDKTIEVLLVPNERVINPDKLSEKELDEIEYAYETISDTKYSKMLAKYPILADIPYYESNFKIDIEYSSPTADPTILVTLMAKGDDVKKAEYTEAARDWLEAKDPTYTKLKIKFVVE